MAHGCDSLMYFRYKGATKGAEQFCYGIIDADNVKRRKFYEVVEIVERGTGDDRLRMLINHNATTTEALDETLAPFE